MLSSIEFMSRQMAEQLTPSTTLAIISISGAGAKAPRLPKCHDILFVEMGDLSEEGLGLPIGTVPEETSDASIPFWRTDVFPMAHDARAILAFVCKLAKSKQAIDLVVHCRAGVSRSAAVAKFIASTFNVPLQNTMLSSTAKANPRIERLLTKVYGGEPLVTHETAPDLE